MSEKCFCHFNGFAVKDATARKEIENIKSGIVTPEMFGAIGDGVTCDADAFINAIRTGKKVVCDSSKTYYFSKPVDVREMNVGHLDGGNAYFVNFHIYININDEFTTWRKKYCADRFIIENMNLGGRDYYTALYEGWETPCIVTGCPTIVKNIVTRSYPYVIATVSEYIDYMLFDSIVCSINWSLFHEQGKEITMDAISCLNKNGEYTIFGDSSVDRSTGDSWRVLACQEFKTDYFPSYKFMHVGSKSPMIFENCIQLSIDIIRNGRVICVGGHWEYSYITFNGEISFGASITFINCFFYSTHTLIDSEFATYINCVFEPSSFDDKRTLADMLGNKTWTDLKCSLINCQFAYDHIIDTDKLKMYKNLPKRTYNNKAINYGKIKDISFTIGNNSWRPSFFPCIGEYTYDIYTMTTSQPNVANEHKTLTATIESQNTKYTEFKCFNMIGGYGFVLVRKDINGVFYRSEHYLDPSVDPSKTITVTVRDYGSWTQFLISVSGVLAYTNMSPWIVIDSKPEITVNGVLYEANGILITSDKSDCDIKNGQVVLNQYPLIDKTITTLGINKNPGIYNFGYINSSGKFTEGSSSYVSDFIEICGDNNISYFVDPTSPVNPANMQIYEFDKYQNLIKSDSISKILSSGTLNPYLLNKNTKYIRLVSWVTLENPEDITGIRIAVYYTDEAVAEFIPYGYIDKTVTTPYLSGTNLRLISDEGSEYVLGVDRDGTLITHKIKEG